MEKKLGKIQDVKLGLGGYQDVTLGIHLTLGDGSWGVGYSNSAWDPEIMKCDKHCKWTEEERTLQFSEIMRYVSKLLSDAKVNCVSKLNGIPIEATFEKNTLKSWRILTEVL